MELKKLVELVIYTLLFNCMTMLSQNDGDVLYYQYKNNEHQYLALLKDELQNLKTKNDYKIDFDSIRFVIHPEYNINNHFFEAIDNISWLDDGDFAFEAFVFVKDSLRFVLNFNKQFGHELTYSFLDEKKSNWKKLYDELNYRSNLSYKLVFKIKGFYWGEIFYIQNNKIMMKWRMDPSEDIEAKIGIRKYYREDYIYDLIK